MAAAVAVWGRMVVLVDNAGYGRRRSSAEMRRQYETNFFGTLDVSTAVLPYMRAERCGTIVMFGSRTSWRPELTCTGLYASSKAALRVFSETLASELAPFGIRMLIVEPAAFRTDALIGNAVYTGNPLPDYDVMRASAAQRYKHTHKALRGDSVKRGGPGGGGEGVAAVSGLGDLGVSGVPEKCERVLHLLDEWKEVSTGLDIDPEEEAR
ncbi:hypothetical protein B0H15DRAFT_950343 [Mycena belliarum]|uniref:Uncharacterized protein n=1 Tax=Mycena belliarum TaxID=1033014 RepID=A0AAD6U2L5_9AGAR|nr:hypothetical protein B0H15DRAFT_950343 [Mycena belliae]